MFSRTKRTGSVKKWHAKAMLVDPRKTKITIINGQRSDLAVPASEESPVSASAEPNVEAIVSCDFPDGSEVAAEIFGIPVSFTLVEEYIESE